MSLIKCEKLCIGFSGRKVVEELSFSVNDGDYLCIVGENGSGKSTLMKTLLHLAKPISGKLVYGEGLKPSCVGYLPQQTPIQKDFPASAYEIVLSGCLNSCGIIPFYTKEQKALARQKMELLRISDLADCCYRELSGGQQQRVLLARALCSTSKLIILDEPVAGLDAQSTSEMYSIISSLHSNGITVIMVTHDSNDVIKHASHVLHIAHKPKFFGTAKDYIESDVGISYMNGGRRK